LPRGCIFEIPSRDICNLPYSLNCNEPYKPIQHMPLLGPTIDCYVKAHPDDLKRIRRHFPEKLSLPKSLDETLQNTIRNCIDRAVNQNEIVHDGYFLTWDLSGLGDDEGELYINASFNVNMKEGDFDSFDTLLLQNDAVLNVILNHIENDIRRYLQTLIIYPADFQTRIESTGAGYG